MGLAYIPLIALAAWRLEAREAFLVALAGACLNTDPHQVDAVGATAVAAVGRDVLQLGTYAFVAWAVGALRHVYRRERTAARRDALTGALNRAAFEEHAQAVLATRTQGRPVAVLALADVDDFKATNDTGGHAAGDAVLRAFATVAMASLGPREQLGRLGGDEFVLVLEADTVAAGRSRIAAIHRGLTEGLGSSANPVTVSMGALVLPPLADLEWTSALRCVDQVMYTVKASGKNGVRVETLGAAFCRQRRRQLR